MSATITTSGKPARKALVDVVRPLVPKRWVLLDDDAAATDSDKPRVRFAQRTVERGGLGDARMHRVTFDVTITVPTETMSAAEALLDDELEAFLHALDAAQLPWTTATKSQFPDEGMRLGYQLQMSVLTNPTPKESE